jgi:hypothetical protein
VVDQWDGYPSVYTWELSILEKLEIVTASPGNFTTRVPDKIQVYMGNAAIDL